MRSRSAEPAFRTRPTARQFLVPFAFRSTHWRVVPNGNLPQRSRRGSRRPMRAPVASSSKTFATPFHFLSRESGVQGAASVGRTLVRVVCTHAESGADGSIELIVRGCFSCGNQCRKANRNPTRRCVQEEDERPRVTENWTEAAPLIGATKCFAAGLLADHQQARTDCTEFSVLSIHRRQSATMPAN